MLSSIFVSQHQPVLLLQCDILIACQIFWFYTSLTSWDVLLLCSILHYIEVQRCTRHIMPPKTRAKSTPVWHRCEKCSAVLSHKDLPVHQDGSCPPSEENWSHGFVKKKVLHSWLGEASPGEYSFTKIYSPSCIYHVIIIILWLWLEMLPSLPSEDLDNIVCVSSPSLQLCGFTVGEHVLVEMKGVLKTCWVKAVWPISDKSVTSVLMSKDGKLFTWIFWS